MKLAYIILAHKNPQQVIRLIRRLNVPGKTTFYVHIDKKAASNIYDGVAEKVKALDNVKMIKRHDSSWGSFGIVQATMEGLRRAVESAEPFDYLINLSGQDYPIKSNEQIEAKLGAVKNSSYIWHFPLPYENVHPIKGGICQKLNRVEYWHIRKRKFHFRLPLSSNKYNQTFSFWHSRFWLSINLILPRKRKFIKNFVPYGGGQWWCLNSKHVQYIYDYVNANPRFYSYFRFTNIPDEIFFQTLLLNSSFRNEMINEDLRSLYIPENSANPIVYSSQDYQRIANSDQLFARKFDAAQDDSILDLIDETLLGDNGDSRQTPSRIFEKEIRFNQIAAI